MIYVRYCETQPGSGSWLWYVRGTTVGASWFDSSAHALRDAWTWMGGHVPALVFTRGAP